LQQQLGVAAGHKFMEFQIFSRKKAQNEQKDKFFDIDL